MSREPFFLSCSGPCDQGRRECRCPEACRQPEPAREERLTWGERLHFYGGVAIALVLFAIGFFAGYQAVMYWIGK